MRSDRLDYAGGLLNSPIELPDGLTVYSGRAARTGSLNYAWGVERRDINELYSIAQQLPGVQITIRHPSRMITDGGSFDDAGRVESATVVDDHVVVQLKVNRAGKSAIKSGLRELSLGYSTVVESGWQKQTRVDHLALVEAGRCGPSCAIRIDCVGGVCECRKKNTISKTMDAMVFRGIY